MKTRPIFTRSISSLLLIGAIGAIPEAQAGNTWTGGGASTNWSDNNNWGGAAPGYGTLTFTTGGTQGTTSNNNSITAMNQLLWTGTASWTLNGSTTLSLFDNGGAQAKIENQSTGSVTINDAITFAANNGSPPNPFGEINAVNGDLTFGTGALTVNGSSVNGIKLFGSNRTTTFNNTVSASGKWFGLTGATTAMAIGGTFTSGDIYVMNGGTLKVNSGANITTSALRLGGDFGNTGNQNQTLGGTLQFAVATGGQSFGSIINAVSGNTSGALLIDSTNTAGVNTISGNIFLDSALRVNQASGGTLSITNATLDVKAQTLTLTGAGDIGITGVIGNSIGSGQLVVGVNGTVGGPMVTLSNANTYSGDTFVRAGTLAFTSAGSAANSTIRLGSSSGSSVTANVILSTPAGGTTISSTINPVTTSGSGTLTLASQNTGGINIYSGHIGMDRNFTITQAGFGTLNITQARAGGVGTTTGTDLKGFTLFLTPSAFGSVNVSGDLYNSTGSGNVAVSGGGSVMFSGVANTYTGSSTVTNGTLAGIGTHAFGSTSVISVGGSGVLSLRGDASTSFTKASDSTSYAVSVSGSDATINVDRATVAGTGAKTMTIGTLGSTSTTAAYQLNFTGANNTSLSLGAVTGPASTAAGNVTIANSIASSGKLTLAGYTSANTAGGETLTFNGAGSTTVTGAINPSATTALALKYTGTGTLTLNGANTYTGATTINSGGRLDVAGTGSLTNSASIAVNSGGTLFLSGTGGINAKLKTTAAITLNSGSNTLAALSLSSMTSSLDQTVGALTLSANSIIDFGTLATGNTFRFADSSAISWTGTTLSIWNWSAGFDHLYFGANSSGLLQSQLNKIKFYSDAGTTILPFAPGFSAFTGSSGEVVPVPEPGVMATALGLLGLTGWRERRRARSAGRAERRAGGKI